MKGTVRYRHWCSSLALTLACGSENQGDGGPGKGAGYDRMYDPKTVETVSGEVVSVDKIIDRGTSYGVSLTLKTDQETILVYLGPDWFIEKQDLTFAPKDQMEITGSQITFHGKPTIIAGTVQKGDKSLKLRDPAGIPAWAGADEHSASIIGKWLLQEMIENSEFKNPNETAEKNGVILKYLATTLWNFTLLIRREGGMYSIMDK